MVWNSILDIRHCLGSCPLLIQLLSHRRLIRRRCCSWREGGAVPAPPPPPPPPPLPTYPPCSSPACTTPPCWPSITCCSSGRSLPFRRLSHQLEVPEKRRIYRRRHRRWTHRRRRMTAVAEEAAAANCWLAVSVPGWRKTRPSHDMGTSLRHRRLQAFSPPYLHILLGLCRCQCHPCCQALTRPCLCDTGLAVLG